MKRIFSVLIVLLMSLSVFSFDLNPYKKHYRDFKEALKNIQEKDTEKASESMINALEQAETKKSEDVDILNFNVANLMKAKGDKEKAMQYYNNAYNGFSDKKDKADTLFNLGNMFLKDNKLKEAIESYVNSYKLNPSDDLKYNLNLAVKKLKEQQQKQKNDQKNNKKQDDKDKKQNKDDQEKNKQDRKNQSEDSKDKNKKDESKQDKDKKEDDNKQQQQQKDQKQSQKEKEQQYNQQQVIKNAQQQEKDALQQFIKKELGEVKSNGKDW